MQTFFRILFLTAIAIVAPQWATAQEFEEPGTEEPLPVPEENLVVPPSVSDDVPLEPEKQLSSLDDLFDKLKKARDPRFAKTIAKSIWSEWFRSGSATTDLMMTWANEAYESKKYNVALDFLDQVVLREPNFAEGWNRRATVHYTMDNFAKSMTDIERTLELEPRHFGALAGMATILERVDRQEAALSAWERALAIYPAMESAQDAVIRLAEELAADPV
jgi:tetratricopeptide (TPR) repeat protein